MFTKIDNYKTKFSNTIITIDQLHKIVTDNPQKDIINKARQCSYKSSEYNNLKSKINCITPHGSFKRILNSDIQQLSGYLFFDIDNFKSEDELNDNINTLINNFPISFIQRSLSNRGIHFLIKVPIYDTKIGLNDTIGDTIYLTIDNFSLIHGYISSLLLKKDIQIDKNATGLSRKMVISSDYNAYLNKESIMYIDKYRFNNYLDSLNKINGTKKLKREYDITLNDTSDDTSNDTIIPLNELLQQIKTKTSYNKNIDGDWVIDKMDSYQIIIPKNITDNTKHKVYTRIINALYYINDNITKNQVLSYIYHINKYAKPPMEFYKLKRLVDYITDNILNTGQVKIKTRIKKIHFNMKSNLTTREKQSIAVKINAKLRRNETIKKINEAKDSLLKQNIIPSQSKVREMTGLSIATIKRNWNIDEFNLDDIDINKKTQENILDKIPTITEDEFFNEPIKDVDIIKHKYKGIEEVEIERKVSDKQIFKNAINYVTDSFGGVLEQDVVRYLLREYNWDKYKIDYFYTNYIKKHQLF